MSTEATETLNNVNIDAVAGLIAAVNGDSAKGATNWRATVDWKGGFRSEAKIRAFDPITSDEPPALGGTDTAPNPVEQVLAALGNCLTVGYAANATARGIEITSLRIDISGPIDLHTFLGLGGEHAGFSEVRADVFLESPASQEDVDALHEHVLRTSPVGHTLQAAIPVTISLAV